MHVKDKKRNKKHMHARNFKTKRIIVVKPESKAKSDCTGVFVSIKTSKQDLTPLCKDLTPLCFDDIIFLREIFFPYSNLLMMFAKIAYKFI